MVIQIVLLSESTLLPDEDQQYVVETSWSIPKGQSWDKRLTKPFKHVTNLNNIFHDIMVMLMMTDDCKEVLVGGLCNVPSFDSASEK